MSDSIIEESVETALREQRTRPVMYDHRGRPVVIGAVLYHATAACAFAPLTVVDIMEDGESKCARMRGQRDVVTMDQQSLIKSDWFMQCGSDGCMYDKRGNPVRPGTVLVSQVSQRTVTVLDITSDSIAVLDESVIIPMNADGCYTSKLMSQISLLRTEWVVQVAPSLTLS